LDVLGAEESQQPADLEGDEATRAAELPSASAGLARPELPKNLILYGPPGTGKTWEVLERIRPDFGERVEMITFHPNFAYEEFVEGLRPITDETAGHVRYQVVPGVFRRVCNEALAHAELPHLLIIDEINRANLAAVFGELITLIEEDKRDKGNVTLPYSKEHFTVPGNLWIVGTMNTADRSIALMDVALRRRFVFREVGVDYTVLTKDFAESTDPLLMDLDLAAILGALNERLRLLVDREHQIGHAWLMGVRSLDDLRERFANRILPLLAEYFFDDWSRICLVLGEDPLTSRETDLVRKTILPVAGQQRLFGRIVRDGGPVVLYDPGEPGGWTVEHFAKIVPFPEMEPEAEK
jgi:5-methylcytosine-specific restriction protein B